jgi:hypothetical protein
MKNFKESYAESKTIIGVMFGYFPVIITFVLILISVFIILKSTGVLTTAIDRKIVQESLQYNDGKVSMINDLIRQYNKATVDQLNTQDAQLRLAYEKQRKSILIQIQDETGRLSNVPPNITAFMESAR